MILAFSAIAAISFSGIFDPYLPDRFKKASVHVEPGQHRVQIDILLNLIRALPVSCHHFKIAVIPCQHLRISLQAIAGAKCQRPAAVGKCRIMVKAAQYGGIVRITVRGAAGQGDDVLVLPNGKAFDVANLIDIRPGQFALLYMSTSCIGCVRVF